MKTFDILSPETPLQGKFFLEASAGTGKTFAIEHIILRNLLEGTVPHVENILAVTFTNAATNELKCRIRSTLTHALHQIQAWMTNQTPFSFPYLKCYDPIQSYLTIKGALADMNRMFVHTIHSFCYELLKQYFPDIHTPTQALTTLPTRDIRQQIQQYLAQELWRDVLYPQQFLFLTSTAHTDSQHQDHLLSILLDSYNDISKESHRLPAKETFEKLWSEHREEHPKATLPATLNDLPLLFRCPDPKCSFTKQFLNKTAIQKTLQHHLKQYLEKTYSLWLSPDATISILEELLSYPEHQDIVKTLRANFHLVLIDEFQDTDRKQWSIFSTLFNQDDFQGSLFLIGDPKQSIYGWRNADLDIFLSSAKPTFEKQGRLFYLSNNYRSTPLLLEGLNLLFSQGNIFSSSRETPIVYHPLQAKNSDPFNYDHCAPIHFCTYDSKEQLAQWISKEAMFLNQNKGIRLGDMAILVADSYQIADLVPYCSVPIQENHKDIKFKQSKADMLVRTLLEACLYPTQDRFLLPMLTSFLFGFSATDATQETTKKKFSRFFLTMQTHLFSHGLLSTFYRIIANRQCTLFSLPIGEAIFQGMEQLCIYLEQVSFSPEQQLLHLKQLKEIMNRETSLYNLPRTDNPDAIKVTTIHSAKGLEYDVVFGVGLNKSSRSKAEKEEHNETANLMYVACTRAKKYLYIPVPTKIQKASIFHEYCKALSANDSIPSDPLPPPILSLIQQYPLCFSVSSANLKDQQAFSPPHPLHPPQPFSFSPPKAQSICSFSSLKTALDKQSKEDGLVSYSSETPLFPVGKRVGTIIHKALALIAPNFNRPRETILSIITSFTNKTSLEPHSAYLCDLLMHLFAMPLPFKSASFCLKDVDKNKVFTEAEFLLEEQKDLWQGSIDLFFEHHGRYYLLDWKTAFLGNQDEDYSYENMLAYVHSEHLCYQAQIYLHAANQFLEQFEIDTKAELAFLFLRGVFSPSLGFLQWSEDLQQKNPFASMKTFLAQKEENGLLLEENL